MKAIFKYNVNVKYSSKDWKGGYNIMNFLLLDIYLNEKGLNNIFKDHHIVAQISTMAVGYDE